jgi:hypothetical protein
MTASRATPPRQTVAVDLVQRFLGPGAIELSPDVPRFSATFRANQQDVKAL